MSKDLTPKQTIDDSIELSELKSGDSPHCEICGEDILKDQDTKQCDCGVKYHSECFKYNDNKCAVPGCDQKNLPSQVGLISRIRRSLNELEDAWQSAAINNRIGVYASSALIILAAYSFGQGVINNCDGQSIIIAALAGKFGLRGLEVTIMNILDSYRNDNSDKKEVKDNKPELNNPSRIRGYSRLLSQLDKTSE
ncbi:hypothetical protein KY330_04275 [Candidatus Woesearchaeota archaeon]|nr:hypothetical protein [Candidatus Woesearchaeota archaeon]